MSVASHRTPGLARGSKLPLSTWLQHVFAGRSMKLDVEAAPDHVKRDLGLISGRPTAPRDPLRD